MIQLQINIHLPPDGMGHVELNRLTREDVNEFETTYAQVFIEEYTELVKFICDELAKQGLNVQYTEIGEPTNDNA
jgi:hypothetical protein